jgi:drug/metabolite transporter (DMT)-like permease
MDFLFPLVRIVSESIGKTIDKLNFRRNGIAARHLVILVFTGMSVSILLYIILAGKPLPHFTYISLSLVLLIGLISFLANVFDFASLKANDLSLREPMFGFKPILAGLVGYILFPEERETILLLAFALGAIAVYLGTHRRKLGDYQKKGMSYLLIAMLFYSLLPSIYKFTLEYVSPEYITLFRAASVLVLTLIFLPVRKGMRSLSKTTYGLSSGVVYALGTVASLYAIQKLGVVVTMLFLLLEPALKYLAGFFVLKEKVRKGEIAASAALAVIVLLVITR